jgi:hypothetical protein
MEILSKAKDWANSLLADEKGQISSKRLVGLICALTLCVTMYQNSFSEAHIAPAESLVNAVALLAFGCLGLSSVDKFTSNKEKIAKATAPVAKKEEALTDEY